MTNIINRTLFFTSFVVTAVNIQAYTIKGIVKDKATGDPLIGATVKIEGTNKGGVTDMDGRFKIDGVDGTSCTIRIQYVSYQPQTLVYKQGDKDVEVALVREEKRLNEVTVTARKQLEGEKALQLERQKATVAIENMGAKEMSLKGISNVQEGVKKITGISIAAAGQLIVRGLGDRYSQTTLNGLPIASPNPDNKLIPLDLFPAATVQNITVSKVYEVGTFADYSGAHIDIGTKESTGADYFTVGFNVGGKFNTLGKGFYKSDRKGSIFKTGNLSKRYWDMSRDDFEKTVKQEDVFGTTFAIKRKTALPDFSGSVGGSKSWRFDNGNQLSLMVSLGISSSSQILKNAFNKTLNVQGGTKSEFAYDSYTSELKLAGLINLGYSFRQGDRISYTSFYARNAVDEYMSRWGATYDENNLLGSNSVFHAYDLFNNQLTGHHEFGDKRWMIDWSGSYGKTGSDEPDRRQVMFRTDEKGNPIDFFRLNQQETNRYFSELDEKEANGDVHVTYNFGDNNLVRVGGAYKNKKRDFKSMNFFYDIDELDKSLIKDIYSTNGYLNFQNIADGTIVVDRKKYPYGSYDAKHDIMAAFIETNYYPINKLLVNLGVRYEQSKQTVNYFTDGGTPETATLNKGDLFPALNLKYSLTDEQSLRFSASRTVTRPAFIEMAPFRYLESFGSASLTGNADLKNGYNINLDLRYDFFPKNSRDMFSVTGYFKLLQDPIERIQTYTGGDVSFSFQNADNGIAAGLEIEARKEIFKDLRLGVNGSFIYTDVKLPEGGAYTESKRALQGASPYLVNADISYAPRFSNESQLILALVYNLQGPRIDAVGYAGLHDVKQDPLHTLNFVGTYQLNRHFSVKLQADNLLNSTVNFKQKVGDTGKKVTVESLKPGTAAEIGVTYRF